MKNTSLWVSIQYKHVHYNLVLLYTYTGIPCIYINVQCSFFLYRSPICSYSGCFCLFGPICSFINIINLTECARTCLTVYPHFPLFSPYTTPLPHKHTNTDRRTCWFPKLVNLYPIQPSPKQPRNVLFRLTSILIHIEVFNRFVINRTKAIISLTHGVCLTVP